MKRYLLFLLLPLLAFASCKKTDEHPDTANLIITAKLAGNANGQPGVNVKVYYGSGTSGTLIYEGLTDNAGKVDIRDLDEGIHTVVASYTVASGSFNDLYKATSSIQLEFGNDHTLNLDLGCTNCCEAGCVNGTVEQTNNYCLCNCSAGYFGMACDSILYRELAGQYYAVETCQQGPEISYFVNISASTTDSLTLLFDNFGDFNPVIVVKAEISTPGTLTIPSQDFMSNTLNISGSGTYSLFNMNINYTYTYNGDTDNCSITLTRN